MPLLVLSLPKNSAELTGPNPGGVAREMHRRILEPYDRGGHLRDGGGAQHEVLGVCGDLGGTEEAGPGGGEGGRRQRVPSRPDTAGAAHVASVRLVRFGSLSASLGVVRSVLFLCSPDAEYFTL